MPKILLIAASLAACWAVGFMVVTGYDGFSWQFYVYSAPIAIAIGISFSRFMDEG